MRARISDSEIPCTSTRFCRDDAPVARRTAPRGNPSSRARNVHNRSFAFPSVGGACTRTFKLSPNHPKTSSRLAPGVTFTDITQRSMPPLYTDAIPFAAPASSLAV